ncbi:MAG: response regulator, partial [Clostridia bacterium]|nr:response regulator [Clostridia bacterium]
MPEERKKTILIVDDEPINRALLEDVFADEYRVETAEDGEQAMRILRRGDDIAAVLLDLVMPRLNGFGVLEQMRADERLRGVPVIVITGSGDIREQDRAFDLGAIDVIIKPINPRVVRRRIDGLSAHMEAAGLTRELAWREELIRASEIDAKTGLLNRQTFCREVEAVL